MTLLALHVFQTALLGPVERFEAWRRGDQAVEAAFRVSSPQFPGGVECTIQLRGTAQEYTATHQGATETLYQDGADIEHRFVTQRAYVEHTGAAGLVGPPPEAGAAALAAYPFFLRPMPWANYANQDGWKRAGTETVGGVPCDVATASNLPEAGGGQVVVGHLEFKAWVDPAGRLVRWETASVERGNRTANVFHFSRMERTGWKGSGLSLPPEGFVPMNAPKRGEGVELGTAPDLGEWLPVDGGKAVDTAALRGKRGLVVLVVAPGCEPSRSGAKLWAQVEERAKAVGAAFVELSLGPEEPGPAVTRARRFWDRSGDLERRLSPPGTPFVLRLDGKGVAVRQWYGYRPGEEAAVLDALF